MKAAAALLQSRLQCQFADKSSSHGLERRGFRKRAPGCLHTVDSSGCPCRSRPASPCCSLPLWPQMCRLALVQVRAMKQQANALADAAAAEKYKLVQAKQEGDSLRCQIVEVGSTSASLPGDLLPVAWHLLSCNVDCIVSAVHLAL